MKSIIRLYEIEKMQNIVFSEDREYEKQGILLVLEDIKDIHQNRSFLRKDIEIEELLKQAEKFK